MSLSLSLSEGQWLASLIGLEESSRARTLRPFRLPDQLFLEAKKSGAHGCYFAFHGAEASSNHHYPQKTIHGNAYIQPPQKAYQKCVCVCEPRNVLK